MKAADYRIPWGRPSEHLLAVKREIIGQQLHVRRVHDARNRSTIDTEPPGVCAYAAPCNEAEEEKGGLQAYSGGG